MGMFIIKINDERDNKDYYLEWSTIIDAPVTYGFDLESFKEYYKEEYGNNGMENLNKRLKRVEKKGTSSLTHSSVDVYFNNNRAGNKEKTLSKEEILDKYCRKNNVNQ